MIFIFGINKKIEKKIFGQILWATKTKQKNSFYTFFILYQTNLLTLFPFSSLSSINILSKLSNLLIPEKTKHIVLSIM